ncbi:hypothetical protein PC128_g18411 [Phytophthora cactorum]|nr:hypothetical protein PC128_g18411 [Phytophthora cactorum]
MLKSWFTATFLTALGLSTYQYVAADQWDGRADEIVDSFSTEDLIGQMAQIDISVLMTDDLELDEDTVRKYAKMRVGSYLNSPLTSEPKNGTYLWTAEKWREVVTRIQEITMEENGGHPMIYGVDSVHGARCHLRPWRYALRTADQRCRLVPPRPGLRARSHHCS